MTQVLEIADKLGIERKAQSSFMKFFAGKKIVYVAKSSRSINRIDIAGFDFDHPSLKKLTEQQAVELGIGKVRAQVDFCTPDNQALDALQKALEILAADTPKDKVVNVIEPIQVDPAPTPALCDECSAIKDLSVESCRFPPATERGKIAYDLICSLLNEKLPGMDTRKVTEIINQFQSGYTSENVMTACVKYMFKKLDMTIPELEDTEPWK